MSCLSFFFKKVEEIPDIENQILKVMEDKFLPNVEKLILKYLEERFPSEKPCLIDIQVKN
jgi:hypothetical protein